MWLFPSLVVKQIDYIPPESPEHLVLASGISISYGGGMSTSTVTGNAYQERVTIGGSCGLVLDDQAFAAGLTSTSNWFISFIAIC